MPSKSETPSGMYAPLVRHEPHCGPVRVSSLTQVCSLRTAQEHAGHEATTASHIERIESNTCRTARLDAGGLRLLLLLLLHGEELLEELVAVGQGRLCSRQTICRRRMCQRLIAIQ